MEMVILDPAVQRSIRERREMFEMDKYDEVWDGVYVVSPLPNDEQQEIVTRLSGAFLISVAQAGLGKVRPGVNVSDREVGWKDNYREPDVAVFVRETAARNLGTHWVGGPDFGVEILSPDDWGRQKLPFYAKVGAREILVVDRAPWALELYRNRDGEMALVGKSTLDQPETLASDVIPLGFRLVPGEGRPRIEVTLADGAQAWLA